MYTLARSISFDKSYRKLGTIGGLPGTIIKLSSIILIFMVLLYSVHNIIAPASLYVQFC